MPRYVCCVPGCSIVAKDGVPLHYFPNPETFAEKFQVWVKNIGGDIVSLDSATVLKTRRICRRHFETQFLYPNNRLSKLAVPTLLLPSGDISAPTTSPLVPDSEPSTSQEALLANPVIQHSTTVNAVENKLDSALSMAQQSTSRNSKLLHSNVINPKRTKAVQYSRSAPTTSPLVPDSEPSPSQEALLANPVIQHCTTVNAVENKLDSALSMARQSISRNTKLLYSNVINPKRTKAVQYSRSVTFLQRKHEDKEVNKLSLKLRNALKAKQTYRYRYLLANKLSKQNAFNIVTKKLSSTAKTLFLMQTKGSGKNPRGRRFTLDEKILALSLYKPSPKAYRFLSQLCVLPSRRTLQNLLQKVDLVPGINEKIFEHLKKKVVKMPEKHKYCCILFDEMSIATNINYDKVHDIITGFVDNGSKRDLIFSDHVLVFMIRGIVKKYKQPIAYSFCSGTTKTADLKLQLKQIIQRVQSTGLKVVATICDQGATNLAAVNQLMEETKGYYLRKNQNYTGGFFEVDSHKIVPIYDPPHLMKGVRNNLLNKELKFVMDGKIRTAKWSHIENLFLKSPTYKGVKLAHKLTAQHVIPSMIPKMKVKFCTQVFSKSVGVTLGCMAENGTLPGECTDTADLLLLFDDLFDTVNGSQYRDEAKIYKSAVTPKSKHLEFWNKTLPILKSMRYVCNNGRETIVPSLTSWVKTIEGFKLIIKELQSKGINTLLLRNFNQDPIENFFGAIRSHGHHNIMPNSAAFETAFKTLVINNITSPKSVQGNCEKDDSVCLSSLKSFLNLKTGKKDAAEDRSTLIEIIDEHINIELLNTQVIIESRSRVHVEKCAAIAYCSGWIATKAKKLVLKKCKICIKNLISNENEDFHKFITKKEYSGKRWLCYPTRALFDFFAHVEHIAMEVLNKYGHKEKIAQYIKLIITVHINFNFIECQKHKEVLLNYLLDKSIVFFINNWCKEVSNVLTGKSYYNFVNLTDETDRIFIQAREHYNKTKCKKRTRQTGIEINV